MTSSAGMRLGDLLTAAGMLKLEQLREAIEIARQQSLPVGRVLIMYGYLSGLQLQAAIHLQSMLKDNLIDYDTSLKVLALIAQSNIPVEEALQQIGWERSEPHGKTNKLGEILLAAGIIDNQNLELGLQHSGVTGLPLGRVLVNLGIISEQLLSSALSAQVLIREQRIDRDKAVHGLIAAKDRQITLEESLTEIGQLQLPLRPGVRLGQLLVMAGLLEEKDLMHALELGLVQEQPIGKTLLGLNLVTEDNLSKALEAQALVADGMDVDQAANILTTAIAKSTTIAHASSLLLGSHKATELESDTPTLPLYQLLQFAGLLGPQELEAAVRVGTQDTEIMSRMLQKAGILDSHVIAAAVACTDLVTKRVLKTEQAIMAVNNCKHMRGSIYEFFDEFGWSHPSGLTPPAQTSSSDQINALETPTEKKSTVERTVAESSGPNFAAAAPPPQPPQPTLEPAPQPQPEPAQLQAQPEPPQSQPQPQQSQSGQYVPLPEASPTPAKPTLTEQLFASPPTNSEAKPWATATGSHTPVTATGAHAPIRFQEPQPEPVTATGTHAPITFQEPQPAPVTATGAHAPIIFQEPQPAPVANTSLQPPEPQPAPDQPEAPKESESPKEPKPRKKLRDLIP
jgi:hypothetical protein